MFKRVLLAAGLLIVVIVGALYVVLPFFTSGYLVASDSYSFETPTCDYYSEDGKNLDASFSQSDWKDVECRHPFVYSQGNSTSWSREGYDQTSDGGTISVGRSGSSSTGFAVQKWNSQDNKEWETELNSGKFVNILAREFQPKLYFAALQDESARVYIYVLDSEGQVLSEVNFLLNYGKYSIVSTRVPAELEALVADGSVYFFYKGAQDFHYAVLDSKLELTGVFDLVEGSGDFVKLSDTLTLPSGDLVLVYDQQVNTVNKNGEAVWSQELPGCLAKEAFISSEGKIDVLGDSESEKGLCMYTLSSETGEVLSTTFNEGVNRAFFSDAEPVEEGGFLVLSTCREEFDFHLCLTRLNSEGKLDQISTYAFLGDAEAFALVPSTSSERFYVYGSQETGDPDYSDYWRQSFQFVVDAEGRATLLSQLGKFPEELKNKVVYFVALRWLSFD